jgi:hypothetical protein
MARHHQEGNAIRGVFYGILFSIPIWIVIAFAVWFFCFR